MDKLQFLVLIAGNARDWHIKAKAHDAVAAISSEWWEEGERSPQQVIKHLRNRGFGAVQSTIRRLPTMKKTATVQVCLKTT